MPVLREIDFSLAIEDLLEAQGQKRAQRPAMVAAAEEALQLGQALFAPAALYDEFEVGSVAEERIELTAAGAGLTIGPMADLLAPTERLLLAVCTIGPALEAQVSELYTSGRPLLSYMLDCAGVLALDAVCESVHQLAEARASERGWGVGPALSPGSLAGWPVQGQRELCALLPLADIGVRLNEYCVLEPHKSVSLVIGMGPKYEAHQVGSICRYCALQDSCWLRREAEVVDRSRST